MLDVMPSPRRRSLLDHFSVIKDARQSCKVMYPLREVILLVVCGTIADCDDYDDIAEWGAAHLDFLRTMSEFHYGIPCEDWLRVIMNRIDPALFSACFEAWVAERWPQVSSLVALDGKTSRRSHDQATGRRALHLVSAFATNRHLVLGQEAVEEKSNEIVAIAVIDTKVEPKGSIVTAQRSYITSRPLSATDLAAAVRSHWAIENNLHWTLDVTFNEDFSRLRKGHGATNMAVVRHFAINLVRAT